jgi:GrpB-like predicted nucleotidyltransferase (UPF0157 family)
MDGSIKGVPHVELDGRCKRSGRPESERRRSAGRRRRPVYFVVVVPGWTVVACLYPMDGLHA